MKNYRKIELLMPIWATLVNLLIAYGVYCLARVIYFLENYSYFSGHLSASYLWQIFAGGWMFDRSAIVYSNIPYIVMMLFLYYASHYGHHFQ